MTTPPPLHVIALISGGKDSFFSLLHCLANNHTVVALANLYPPPSISSPNAQQDQDGPSDLNSYMYQTVGHALIPLYAKALGIPLYRQQIAGTAVDLQKDYSAPAASVDADSYDETESLLPLLRKVLADHPYANALSAGAILSTYQRTRIESIALRLGLTPLAFLWQYPYLPTPIPSPAGLLRDMAAVGFDARIVKVASGGLDERFLWENVCEERVIRRIEKAVGRFGGSVLGEGGEYETVVVRGPAGVWKGELAVRDSQKIVRIGEGGEALLEFTGEGTVEMVAEGEATQEGWKQKIKTPGLWDPQFESLVEELRTMHWDEPLLGATDSHAEQLPSPQEATTPPDSRPPHPPPESTEPPAPWSLPPPLTTTTPSLIFFSNLTGPASSPLTTQITHTLNQLLALLRTHALPPTAVLSTTILLRSMASFPTLNTLYATLFPHPNPPARATLACGIALPPGINIVLSAIALAHHPAPAPPPQGLHVQSRSYWAPANIGPYSQAIAPAAPAAHLVHVAGQIALVPATMEVLRADDDDNPAPFATQAALALQHQWRIGTAMRTTCWASTIAFLVAAHPAVDAAARARAAWHCWERLHQPPPPPPPPTDPEPDVWDRAYGSQRSFAPAPTPAPPLPDFARLSAAAVPGFFAVQVAALPRGSAVEWVGVGVADAGRVEYRSSSAAEEEGGGVYGRVCADMVGAGCGFEHVAFAISCSDAECVAECAAVVGRRGRGHATLYVARAGGLSGVQAQVVPCERVWGPGGVEVRAGLVVLWVGGVRS
ncbi:hypothetical protein MMC26_006549 [Xylographa opegraphella]|nr:hypothetical protein [Xylographa opegraphella]